MATGKATFYLAIVAIVVAVTQADSAPQEDLYASRSDQSHHLVVGYRLPGDRLVLRQNVIKNSAWMQKVVEEKTFNTTRFERITLVQALDQKTNGNGAYASITNGGPGSNSVSMRFKSQRGHGINFVVELYASP